MDYLSEYEKLRNSLPRLSLGAINNQNCNFCNYIDRSKNCYLMVNTLECEKCLYGRRAFYSIDCVDCNVIEKCELCYQCLDCKSCYNCNFLQDCEQCTDCDYCSNCKGCQNCFGCTNLRHKRLCIFNQPYSKEDYYLKMLEVKKQDKVILKKQFEEIKNKATHEAIIGENNENSNGNHIFNNQNVQYCFETKESQDCGYSYELFKCQDCVDVMIGEFSKFNYNCVSSYHLHNSNFCYNCWESSDLEYCEQCYQCDSCLFCVNLRHKKYHILNKPYTQEEYQNTKNKIIAEMKANSEFGKWTQSTYPFEDTMAFNYSVDPKLV